MSMYQLIKPTKTAILNIDIQVDYCSPNGKLAILQKKRNPSWGDTSPIEEMIPKLEKFTNIARDYNVPIIWIRMTEDSKKMPSSYLIKRDYLGQNFTDLCVIGTEGFEYYKVNPDKKDNTLIVKNEYNAFTNPDLNNLLKKLGVKNVIINGVFTSRCVRSTVQGAVEHKYGVIIPKDLVAMYGEYKQRHEDCLDDMGKLFGFVTDSKTLIDTWNQNNM